jgi:hypothetical protein
MKPHSEEGDGGSVGSDRFLQRPRAESRGLRATGATRSLVPIDSM